MRKGIRKSFWYKICSLVQYSVTDIVVTWTYFSDLYANDSNLCSKVLTVVCHLNVPMRYTTVIILSLRNIIFYAVVWILKGKKTSIKNLFLILDLFSIVRKRFSHPYLNFWCHIASVKYSFPLKAKILVIETLKMHPS